MASTSQDISFDRHFDPRTGQPVEIMPGVTRITAPNRGAYTFTGTNSFVMGDEEVFILDPGPDKDAHLWALQACVGRRKVRAILLTHTHKDHSALARRAAKAFSAPLWFGGQHRQSRPSKFLEINRLKNSCDWSLRPDRVLTDGEAIRAGNIELDVLSTPGHCANHLAFGIKNSDRILTGDHVMGWNSTLVAVPDGSMHDYLASLDKLIVAPYSHYLPAHGGEIAGGRTYAGSLKSHRLTRNRQIMEELADGSHLSWTLTRRIYRDVPANVLPAAHMTLKAHLEYLAEQGEVHLLRTPVGLWARLVS